MKGRDAGDERPGLEPKRCGVWPQRRDPHGSLLPAARGGEQWTPQPHQSPAGTGTHKVNPGSQFSVLGISYFYLLLLFGFLLQCSSIPSFFWYCFFFIFCLDYLKFKVSIMPPSSFLVFLKFFSYPPDISYFLQGLLCRYFIQHCFTCRLSDSTAAGIEPRTVATSAVAVILSSPGSISHSHWTRSHPHWARSHFHLCYD